MILLGANQITKYYGERALLDSVSFDVQTAERVGLVGVNGCGKSTLLKILTGTVQPDSGTVFFDRETRLGYMEQHVSNDLETGLYDETLSVFRPLLELERQLEETTRALEKGGALEQLVKKQSDLNERYEREGGYTFRSRTRAALLGLGFTEEQFTLPMRALSGGQRSKVLLCKLLLSGANLLLLDEPTNFLDLPSVEALQSLVREYAGTVLFVSHDRAFTEHCATRLLRIENKKLVTFEGTLSQWEESLRHPRETPEDTRRAVLELRITQVIAGLSTAQGEEKEKLEREFQELLRQRKREEP